MVPAATASHHIGPPDWTGMGGGNVLEEVRDGAPANHPADDNGFQDKADPDGDWFTSSGGELLLDTEYAGVGQYPYFVDVNAIISETAAEAGVTYQDRMYPGWSFFASWWGWWQDTGSGGPLNDGDHPAGPASGVNPLTGDDADGVINDGHDNHDEHEDSRYTGPWDEFVWRGENPWASQHGKSSHADDHMHGFVQPGTHRIPNWYPTVVDWTFYNDRDEAQHPDFVFDDRTTQPASSPGPVRHNNIGFGWVSAVGWWGFEYDQSFVMATEVTAAANADRVESGSPLRDLSTATMVDHDVYSALHPAVEDAYRMTVWNPECDRASDTHDPGSSNCQEEANLVGENTFINNAGPKAELKDHVTEIGKKGTAPIIDAIEPLIAPAAPGLGAGDDATGFKPWPKEPDTGEEDFSLGLAANDDAVYGEVGDYYQQDGDADYSVYEGPGDEPWIDARPNVIWPTYQYQVQLRSTFSLNFFPTPTTLTDDAEDRTIPPGHSLHLEANAGAWDDVNSDGWIGNLEQEGRLTDTSHPYRDGLVDDPQDYSHNPEANTGDPTVSLPKAEWSGATDASIVNAKLCPVSPSEVSDPATFTCTDDHEWGETGVYRVRDWEGHPDQQWTPRDDIVEDVAPETCAAPNVGEVFRCENTDRLSEHFTEGEIELVMPGGESPFGSFNSGENVIFPEGNHDYWVRVEMTATLDGTGTDVDGTTVRDVDYLVPTG